jgi:hypothetical protein
VKDHCAALVLGIRHVAGGRDEGGELSVGDFGLVDPEARHACFAGALGGALIRVAERAAEGEAAARHVHHAGPYVLAPAGG